MDLRDGSSVDDPPVHFSSRGSDTLSRPIKRPPLSSSTHLNPKITLTLLKLTKRPEAVPTRDRAGFRREAFDIVWRQREVFDSVDPVANHTLIVYDSSMIKTGFLTKLERVDLWV